MSLSEEVRGRNKDRRTRDASESENDPKRSKFNLNLEKVSPSRTRSLSAAGASLKSFLFRKKSKSKDISSSLSSSDTPFINPIPIVAAAQVKNKNKTKSKTSKSKQILSTTYENAKEMQEKYDDDDEEEILDQKDPIQEELFTPLGSLKSNPVTNSSPNLYHSQQYDPQHNPQKIVSVPKPISLGDRIPYEFYHDPHLHNFALQGHHPYYHPNKKLIFRPTSYPNNVNHLPGNNLSLAYANKSNSPRGPVFAHIRGPFPPPRLIHQNLNPYPRPQQRSPVCLSARNNYHSYHQPNFPSHNPNLVRHPLPPSGERFANYYNDNGQLKQIQNHENNQQHPLPQKQQIIITPPIPKQRKSLIKVEDEEGSGCNNKNVNRQNLPSNYENIIPYWNNLPNGHKLPRVPVPITELHQRQMVIEHMKNISTSNTSLSANNVGKSLGNSGSTSRVSSCNSRKSDIDNSIPWFRWFVSRLEKEGEPNRRTQATYDKSDTNSSINKNCIRCNKLLPNSTKKGFLGGVINSVSVVECSICSLKVCKSCAVWEQSKNSYSCGHCHPPKSIDKKKNFWFDNISPHTGTNFTAAERDKSTEEVREHLERIVEFESQVYEGIDSVSLSRLFEHQQYEVIFHRFHEELSDALMNLGFSLKLAIENKPMNETPTSAHSNLTEILIQIKETAMSMPLMEPINKTDEIKNNINSASSEVQPSYEDVLATAVINKAVINGQKLKRKVDSPMSLVDSAVQTDSEMSESSEVISHRNQYNNVRGWVSNLEKTPPQQHPNLSDDDLSMGTSSSNWSNEGNSKGNTKVVIEEHVEEITTTYESDSDISKHPPVRNRKGRKTARQRNVTSGPASNHDDTLLGVNITHFDSRVPFPEGGIDIVPRSKANEDANDDDDPTGILISQISEWEQNWLFKRRKQILRKRNLMAESVPMLVPNPTEDGVEPQIGTDKISDLSDLSDHVNENGDDDDDFDLSSSEQSEEDEVNANPPVIEAKQIDLESSAPKVQQESKQTSVEQPSEVKEEPFVKMIIDKTSSRPANIMPRMSVSKPKPKKVEKKPEEIIEIEQKPSNSETLAGKTAKFSCIAAEKSPDFSVAWFHDGQLLTTKEGKTWIYSCGKTHHFLYIYNVNEDDSGKYHISLFDYKGNETKYLFNLAVTGSYRKKPEAPTFTVLENTVRVSKSETVIAIPFEITGYPEPYLQVLRNDVDISKLSHVYLEDEGDGKWKLELRRKDNNFKVNGTYVAFAKNPHGVTKVTFMIQEGEESSVSVSMTKELETKQQNGLKIDTEKPMDSISPQPLSRPVSVASEASSIGETMRETSHTLNRNQTMIKEDYEADLQDHNENNFDHGKMSVSEKEKQKWAHPISLPNNPYAPENLEKRIRQRENGSFALPPSSISGDMSVTSSDDERPIKERSQSLNKFARDYYVHGVSNQPTTKLKSADGPNFGSSRSLSVTSNSSREGSNEKESTLAKPGYFKPNMSSSSSHSSLNKDFSEVPKISKTRENGDFISKNPPKIDAPRKEFHIPEVKKEAMLVKVTDSEKLSPPLKSIVTSKEITSPRTRRHVSDVGITTKAKDGADLKQIKLPSVRRLAQQFQTPEEPQPSPEIKPQNGYTGKVFNQEIINRNYQQCHSLTARSVSKQFREGLKLAHPNQTDINIKLKTHNGDIVNGKCKESSNESESSLSPNGMSSKRRDFASNESLDVSCANNVNSNSNSKPSRKSQILARAEFWDKRVKEKILDDDIMIQEFPKMT